MGTFRAYLEMNLERDIPRKEAMLSMSLGARGG
jgi:hypothetical protein